MTTMIENNFLSAEIAHFGAELWSLKSKKTGEEYLWQGDPAVWSGRSPLLFPIIGQLLHGVFRYRGQEYCLEKHGFARTSRFTLTAETKTSAVFTLESTPETLCVYPFDFRLDVSFELIDSGIRVTHTVRNMGENTMFFSIGAHPGFRCELGDYLEFSEKEKLESERIDEHAILDGKTYPLLDNTETIPITADLFVNDALFLSGVSSRFITLKSPRHNRELKFTLNGAPFLGIWAKPAAPYVCIEPWYGINDDYCEKADISQKRGILSLEPSETFCFAWEAEVLEP